MVSHYSNCNLHWTSMEHDVLMDHDFKLTFLMQDINAVFT